MNREVIDKDFMPFSPEQLAARFAFTSRKGATDPVARFVDSAKRYRAHVADLEAATDPREVRRARQIEKDETFWTAACLMRFYEASNRQKLFAELLDRALDRGPDAVGYPTWTHALDGDLELFFEVGLSSPMAYREWLRDNLKSRNLVPYVLEAGAGRTNLEGRTHLDALLLAPQTGFAVHFDEKVTSDIDSKVSFDLMRNQIARNIDCMLEAPGGRSRPPLSLREPAHSVFVLLTPQVFRDNPHSRFYGFLMDEYRKNPRALARDLAHRQDDPDWNQLSKRLGWLTWEECNEVLPGSCGWLAR